MVFKSILGNQAGPDQGINTTDWIRVNAIGGANENRANQDPVIDGQR